MLGNSGSSLELWSIRQQATFYKFNDIENYVNSICFSSDGENLCIATDSEYLQLINLYNGTRSTLETGSSTVNIVKSCPNNNLYVAGSKTGPITLINDKGQKSVFRGHKFSIEAFDFTSDSRTLISGDKHGSISMLVNFKKPSKLPNWTFKNGQIYDICISKRTNAMIIACGEQLAQYDLGETRVTNFLHFGECKSAIFSPYTDSLIAIGGTSGDLFLFDPKSNQIINQISFENQITGMDFRFDGCTLGIGIQNDGMKLIDIRKLETQINTIDLFNNPNKQISTIAFQPCDVKKPLYTPIAEEMKPVPSIVKKTIKKGPKIVQPQEIPEETPLHQSKHYDDSIIVLSDNNNVGSFLNSSLFIEQSIDSESFEVPKSQPDDEQKKLIKIAKEMNYHQHLMLFDQESESSSDSFKLRTHHKVQSKETHNIDTLAFLKSRLAQQYSETADGMHEHLNRFHLDMVKQMNETSSVSKNICDQMS